MATVVHSADNAESIARDGGGFSIENPMSSRSDGSHTEETARLPSHTGAIRHVKHASLATGTLDDFAKQFETQYTYWESHVDCLEIVFMWMVAAIPALFFLPLCTGMWYGYGDEVYIFLQDRSTLSNFIGASSVVAALTLYLFDVSYWESRMLGRILMFLVFCDFCVASLLLVDTFPAAVIGIFLFVTPVWFFVVKLVVFHDLQMGVYLLHLSRAILFSALVVLSIWIVWMIYGTNETMYEIYGDENHGMYWDRRTKYDFFLRMKCDSESLGNATWNVTTRTVDFHEEMNGCIAAFLLWCSPLVFSIFGIVLAVTVLLLVGTLERHKAGRRGTHPITQIFSGLIILSLSGIYVSAGINGAEMGLSSIVMAFSFFGFAILATIIISLVGWSRLKTEVESVPIGKRLLSAFSGDWAKALVLMMGAPFLVMGLFLSYLNQWTRKLLPFTKQLTNEDRNLRFTLVMSKHVNAIWNWNWTAVLIRIMWIGVIFFTMNVGVGRVTTLAMSVLNERLRSTPLAVTLGIFILVGISMFLLPPVPGVPVYIAGGVILVNAAWNNGEGVASFWGAVALTIVVGVFLKLSAVTIQQKGFGQGMRGFTSIRAICGVNSISIRAIKVILEKPGLSRDKVAILIGGPDWPTSVLTGILGLRLLPMLIGTLPIVFLITPCVCAGAFMLRTNEGGAWESAGTTRVPTVLLLALAFPPAICNAQTMLAFSAISQSLSLLCAMYFIEKVSSAQHDKLEAMEVDEAVAALDERKRQHALKRAAATRWWRVPLVCKVSLILGSIFMIASCYAFQLFGSTCFEAYEVTDTISEALDGEVSKLVKPFGWYALALFGVALLLWNVFSVWVSIEMRRFEWDKSKDNGAELGEHTGDTNGDDAAHQSVELSTNASFSLPKPNAV